MFFDEIPYQFKLAMLRRSQRSISAFYAPKVEQARKDEPAKLQQIWHDENEEYSLIEEEIRQLQTRHLTRIAHDLFLPNELQTADWEEGNRTGARYISLEAANRLESAIRKKQAERRQALQFWLAGTTGIIGALTGLVAVIKK